MKECVLERLDVERVEGVRVMRPARPARGTWRVECMGCLRLRWRCGYESFCRKGERREGGGGGYWIVIVAGIV